MLGWLLRVILIALVIQALWRLLAGMLQTLNAVPNQPRVGRNTRDGSKGDTALVKDPVCGTYVARSQALSVSADGERHYFCSEECRAAFGRHGHVGRTFGASR